MTESPDVRWLANATHLSDDLLDVAFDAALAQVAARTTRRTINVRDVIALMWAALPNVDRTRIWKRAFVRLETYRAKDGAA